jgi:hypothetical protein
VPAEALRLLCTRRGIESAPTMRGASTLIGDLSLDLMGFGYASEFLCDPHHDQENFKILFLFL